MDNRYPSIRVSRRFEMYYSPEGVPTVFPLQYPPSMEKHRRSAFWQKEAAEKAAIEASEKAMQDQWRSQSRQDSVEASPPSAFTFTPFKEPSGNRVEIADPPTGTLKRIQRNPNYNTLQPQRPTLKFEVTQQGPPTRSEISRTWGRPGGARAPQMGSIRASSVIGQNGSMTMGRPQSRTSEAALGMTRYQSYCTLPRPEDPLDTENLVAAHLAAQQQQAAAAAAAQQQNVFYVPFQTYSMPPPPPSAATLPRPPPQPMPVPVSMPPPPPPPPEFRPPVHFINAQPEWSNLQESPSDRRSDLIPWEGIQLLGYMHILLSICIFTAGGYRIIQGAKWAIGIEMVYAILVLSNAFLGLFAVNRHRLQAIVAHFVFSSFNLLLAAPPILLGLMPWFAENHLSINPKWFISETEPFSVDYCLAVLVMFEAFICGLTVVMGCRAVGNALQTVVELKRDNEGEQRPTKC